MIYTYGRKKSYEQYFKQCKKAGGPLLKTGKDEWKEPPYAGGIVFKTEEEARANCPEFFEVYGVLADWESQTYFCSLLHQALKVDAELVRLGGGQEIPRAREKGGA